MNTMYYDLLLNVSKGNPRTLAVALFNLMQAKAAATGDHFDFLEGALATLMFSPEDRLCAGMTDLTASIAVTLYPNHQPDQAFERLENALEWFIPIAQLIVNKKQYEKQAIGTAPEIARETTIMIDLLPATGSEVKFGTYGSFYEVATSWLTRTEDSSDHAFAEIVLTVLYEQAIRGSIQSSPQSSKKLMEIIEDGYHWLRKTSLSYNDLFAALPDHFTPANTPKYMSFETFEETVARACTVPVRLLPMQKTI